MVWSEQIGVSLIVPSDARPDDPTDTRDYIILGEDVPDEVASVMHAGLVFHNKSGHTDGWTGTEPLWWAIGITNDVGSIEFIMFYPKGSPSEGGFTLTPLTMLEIGQRGTPTVSVGQTGSFPGFVSFMMGDNTPRIPVTYAAGVAPYIDSAAGLDGLYAWRKNGVITVSGAFRLNVPVSNTQVIATLPPGMEPPSLVQPYASSSLFLIRPDGTIRATASLAAGFIASLTGTYGGQE